MEYLFISIKIKKSYEGGTSIGIITGIAITMTPDKYSSLRIFIILQFLIKKDLKRKKSHLEIFD